MFLNISDFPVQKSSKKVSQIISQSDKKIEELLKSNDTFKDFLKPYQEILNNIETAITPISTLNSVKNTKSSQREYLKVIELATLFFTKLSQDDRIYSKVQHIKEHSKKLSHEEQKIIDDMLRDFKLSGVHLPRDKKDEIKNINLSLSKLQNDFFQNVLNDTNSYKLEVYKEDIEEMPENEKMMFKKDGKYIFTLHAPSFLSFMTYCSNRKKREELYKAYYARGKQNSKIIEEILFLRKKLSNLLGFNNFAELSLASKDAKSPENVMNFLESFIEKCRKKGESELNELSSLGKKLGIKDIKPYDTAYLSEKLKKLKFGYTDEDFRVFFPKDKVVEGLFKFCEKLFGINFKKVDMKLWHPKAEVFDIYLNNNQKGRLYLDLEARKGKRDGAWMQEWETRYLKEDNTENLPSAFIVGNFPKSNPRHPSLLRPGDVETLFHEMGHALHHLLSACENIFVSGIHGVKWDVVEFPSQFMESFFYEERVLDMVSQHYKTGEKMPEKLKKGLNEMKNFNSGIAFLRQLEFGIFDMEIHSKNILKFKDVHQTLKNIRKKTSLLEVPEYVYFENQFSHIFSGGYAAGYYSYKWAERLSADAYYIFLENDIFNNKISEMFLNTLLSKGGSIDITESFKNFAGREINNDSLLKLNGIV